MSSLHGDAAVARLDAAVDAFLDIMTAPENTLVPVPERSPQPSLAERARVNLKPSTDLAKGYADAARRSAQEAAQITGLETVADAIGLAALPLPDVWAPLSDNLRLITGYGREVLVGADVVARMVNFTRSTAATYIGKDGTLKTAAANEPRFEKDGLLIEGQSTNLVPRSQQFNWQDGNGASPGVQTQNTDQQTSSLIPMIDVSPGRRRPLIPAVLTVGKTYTISFRAKSNGGAISQLANQLTGAVYPAVVPDEWKTYSFTGVATTQHIDFQISGTSVSIAWIQAEELTFASSYIPTSGAAVTRAADVVTIPAPNNITAFGYTVAVEFDTLRGAASITAENACIFAMEQDYRARIGVIRGKYGGGDPDYGFSTHCGAYGQAGYVTAVLKNYAVKDTKGIAVVSEGGGLLKMRINSALTSISSASATAAPLPNTIRIGAYGDSGQMALFGHVKNMRMWQRSFSDEKMKAVA